MPASDAAATFIKVLGLVLSVIFCWACTEHVGVNQAAINELSQGVQTLSGDADLEVLQRFQARRQT